MMKRLGVVLLAAIVGMGICSPAALAQLVITEVWQAGSTSTTPDWFELTNLGSSAIDPSTLYYDDGSSPDPTVDSQLAGITNLAPGESAVYLVSWHDDFPGPGFPPPFDPSDALAAFENFWGVNGAYQVGYILDPVSEGSGGGAGLGGGGDTVNVFDGNTAGAMLIDSKGYQDSSNEVPEDSSQGATWVYNPLTMSDDLQHAALGVFGAFSSVGGTQIGSPGAVPEPGSILLMLVGASVLALRRRRLR